MSKYASLGHPILKPTRLRWHAFRPYSKRRTLKFNVPDFGEPLAKKLERSDRLSTWDVVKTFLPHSAKMLAPPSPKEAKVMEMFGLGTESLIRVPPLASLPSPFTYHSTVNGDVSYVKTPRLSVTKLLVGAWCELRTFLEVYAGLPPRPSVARLESGRRYHEKIEAQSHKTVDVSSVEAQIGRLLEQHPPNKRDELVGPPIAAKLAADWISNTVVRSIELVYNYHVREIPMHAFLNLQTGELVTESARLEDAVLVNGIADAIEVMGLTQETLQHFAGDQHRGAGIVDLSEQLATARRRAAALAQLCHLRFTDVKTRERNTIPNQQLVIDAAKVQCMLYTQFTRNLSSSFGFAYSSCLQNGRVRGVDPDAPIGLATATTLLLAHFEVLAQDCIKLAQGQPFEFGEASESTAPYSLGSFLSEGEFRHILTLVYGDRFDRVNISCLFGVWQKPLTFRHIAARTAQAFQIYRPFDCELVSVEYHNVRTGRIIEVKTAAFDASELAKTIRDVARFWNGSRPPVATDDLSKCRYCDFKGRCAVGAPKLTTGLG